VQVAHIKLLLTTASL